MSYTCQNCGNTTSERPLNCFKCSCSSFNVSITVSDTIKMTDIIAGKVKDVNNKLKQKFWSGYSYFKKDDDWHFIDRLVDKENDFYKEIIKDSAGRIIKDVIELLSEHVGHGDDNKSKIIASYEVVFGKVSFISFFDEDCDLRYEPLGQKDFKNEEINKVKDFYVVRFFIKNNSNQYKKIKIKAQFINFDKDLIFDNATGENLEAFSFENDKYILHFGCPDKATLACYNANNLDDDSEFLFENKCTEFCLSINKLTPDKEFYCHFIIASQVKDSNNNLTWFLVDQPKSLLDKIDSISPGKK